MLKKRGFLWIGPSLLIIASIINLLNSNISNGLRIAWLVLLPISIILTVTGVISHIREIRTKKIQHLTTNSWFSLASPKLAFGQLRLFSERYRKYGQNGN